VKWNEGQMQNPNALGNVDKLREVADILAAGVLRLRSCAALPDSQLSAGINPPESDQDCLAIPDETLLSVTRGVNGPRSQKGSKTC